MAVELLLIVVSVIMTPPALTGDGATYTVSRTLPTHHNGHLIERYTSSHEL